MKLVVLESPYAGLGTNAKGQVEANVAYSKRCLLDCLKRGEAPIASHLLFTQDGVLDDNNKEQRALGIAAGHAWIEKCDYMVVYTDRGISTGMQAGIQVAKFFDIHIEYRTLD